LNYGRLIKIALMLKSIDTSLRLIWSVTEYLEVGRQDFLF